MVRRGSFIGGQDNLSVPDAPTIGAATAGSGQVSVAFTAPSDVGDDPITGYGASATDGTNVIGGTGSSSPVTISGLTNGTSYTAQVWAINDYGNGPLSAATSSFTPASIALIKGGYAASAPTNTVQKISVETTGNSTDFGDLSESKGGSPGSSNGTRGLFWAGNKGGTNNKSSMIDYITIANTGNASDFGDIWANGLNHSAACGDDTRGINAGGYGNYGNVGDGEYGAYQEEIEYVTYDTTSNSSDFGDLTQNRDEQASCSDMTIAVWAGGQENSTYDIIDYVTIQTTGNATDFGDLIHVNKFCSGTGDSVNGCICCGRNSSNNGAGDFIQYITYATPGNATDTCDALTARHYTCSISGE